MLFDTILPCVKVLAVMGAIVDHDYGSFVIGTIVIVNAKESASNKIYRDNKNIV